VPGMIDWITPGKRSTDREKDRTIIEHAEATRDLNTASERLKEALRKRGLIDDKGEPVVASDKKVAGGTG